MEQTFRQTIYQQLTVPTIMLAKLVQAIMTVLVLTSIGLFIVEFTYPDVFASQYIWLYRLELIIVIIFSIEYLLKVWSAPQRLKFILSFYGLIDLLAILPFFLHIANLSFLRSVRLLRLLRIAKLFRLAKVMQYVQAQLGLPTIVQENVVKNIVVIVALYASEHYVQTFFSAIDPATLPDVILAASVLAVAAMFGFFSVSYADLNSSRVFDRFILHFTTAMLMLPIGLMFLVVQVALQVEIQSQVHLMSGAIWLVYGSIVLWDFWNVRRVEQKLIQ
ncbi:MAG TPA: hypothetical protein DEG44_04750 [Candidatus Kerfeldbacteria bacterium]|nr:hypothetical protein [Candidatus Kerfeldbacteria bacterium]